ncbi:MAG: hypothetical protein FWE27_06590, partial [Defluviitaleaceae bacterium]|nr:hypothetical protein [Defluviitaleaceae bacterium]
MKKLSKNILAVLLSFIMVFSLVTVWSIEVEASVDTSFEIEFEALLNDLLLSDLTDDEMERAIFGFIAERMMDEESHPYIDDFFDEFKTIYIYGEQIIQQINKLSELFEILFDELYAFEKEVNEIIAANIGSIESHQQVMSSHAEMVQPFSDETSGGELGVMMEAFKFAVDTALHGLATGIDVIYHTGNSAIEANNARNAIVYDERDAHMRASMNSAINAGAAFGVPWLSSNISDITPVAWDTVDLVEAHRNTNLNMIREHLGDDLANEIEATPRARGFVQHQQTIYAANRELNEILMEVGLAPLPPTLEPDEGYTGDSGCFVWTPWVFLQQKDGQCTFQRHPKGPFAGIMPSNQRRTCGHKSVTEFCRCPVINDKIIRINHDLALATKIAFILSTVFPGAAEATSPLAINPTGRIETVPFRDGVHFDHMGNGMKIRTSWVAPNTALLVRPNANGQVLSGRELFGDSTIMRNGQPAANGFEALRDLVGSDIFDRNNPYWNELYLWFDKNTNGIVDAGELVPLSETDIEFFDLNYENSDFIDKNGNFYKQISTATMLDGSEAEFIDIWFIRNIPLPNVTPAAAPEIFGISAMSSNNEDLRRRVEALPQISAFGIVYDLHTAMMADEQLLILVEQFTTEENPTIRENLVPQIIHRWTSINSGFFEWPDYEIVQQLSIEENPDIDSDLFTQIAPMQASTTGSFPNLAALEALTGERYTGQIHHGSTAVINRGFDRLANTLYAILDAQTHLWYLYELAEVTGGTKDFPVFDITPVAYELLRIAATDREKGETLILDFVRSLQTLIMLDAVNLSEFRAVLAAEDTLFCMFVDIAQKNPDEIIWGTAEDDTINVNSNISKIILPMGGNDKINISGGNHTLRSSHGNDTITITNGNNTIDPGTGNNIITGGVGVDTYVIGRGYGHNTITANSGWSSLTSDRLRFKDGITPEDVYFIRTGNNLEVYIVEPATELSSAKA